jgi:two-component system, sporulation sensor kinase E
MLLSGGKSMVKTDIQMLTGMDKQHASIQVLAFYPATSYVNMAARLISHIDVGILLLDTQQKVVEINHIASQYLGIERSCVIYREINHVISHLSSEQPDFQSLVSFLTSPIAEQRQIEIEWNVKEKKNQLRLTAIAAEWLDPEMKGTYIFVENVTKVRSLEQQIRCNQRLATIGQVAAGTAHEIRNPLTSIRGFLQVIGYKLKEFGQQKEQGYIDIMLKEINRINHLVSEFLLLSKPHHMDLGPVQVNHVLSEILPIIKGEAILHNIDVVVEKNCRLVNVIADEELLKQVFLNLCKNSIEAMGEDGCLSIRLYKEDASDFLVVDIVDTGPGIPENALNQIFEPFFTTKENGTGLGLPICQQIIKEIGGMIRVNTGEEGTTFSVYLPAMIL